MKPLKVVHIVSRLNVGGISVHVQNLCVGLSKQGFESFLITGRVGENEGDMLELLQFPGVTVITVPGFGRSVSIASDFHAVIKLRRILKDIGADITHTHATKAGAIGRIAAWLAGVPIRVHTFHGHHFHGHFSAPFSHLLVVFEKILTRISDAIVTPGEQLLRDIANSYKVVPMSKGHVIPHGIEVAAFDHLPGKNDAQRLFGIPSNRVVIGMIGRMVPVKNHRLMLDSMVDLCRSKPGRFHLLIQGDGDLRQELESSAVNLGIGGSVSFAGWQPTLLNAFAAMDLFALTSKNEGIPTSVLEAMAARVPVVATAVGGVVDVVRHQETGLLVPSNDQEALTNALLLMAESRELRDSCVDNAFKLVRSQYDVSNAVAAASKLYEMLFEGKGAGLPVQAHTTEAKRRPS